MTRKKNGRRKRNEAKQDWLTPILGLGVLGVGAWYLMGSSQEKVIESVTPEEMKQIDEAITKSGVGALAPSTFPFRGNFDLLLKTAKALELTKWKALAYLYAYLILGGHLVSQDLQKRNVDISNATVDQLIGYLIAALKKMAGDYTVQSVMLEDLGDDSRLAKIIDPLVAAGAMTTNDAQAWKIAIPNLRKILP